MKFRLNSRHWLLALVLFLLNMIVLMLRIPQGSGLDVRIVLLMAGCSAVVALITAVLLVTLFDRISRTSRTRSR